MKTRSLLLGLVFALAASVSVVSAQDIPEADLSSGPTPMVETIAPIQPQAISGTVSLTPELWLYLHEQQRQDDPQKIVQRKAQMKAEARRNRIAAMKWFGYSAARPRANPSPWTSRYSDHWTGNSNSPYQWRGVSGVPVIAVQIDRDTVRR
jgi:hypothetical protein